MGETWKPVISHSGLYEVSDLGSVRSLDRLVRHFRTQVRLERGRPIKPKKGPKKYPYLSVYLYSMGLRRSAAVHTLVLEAFVGPCPAGMQCRHLNGDSMDNRLENLAWGTLAENTEDKRRHGTIQNGEGNAAAKLTDRQVLQIRADHAGGESVRAIADRTGVPRSTVSHIVRRYSWRHL